MLLTIAALCFIAQVLAWLLLPSSARLEAAVVETVAEAAPEPRAGEAVAA